MLQLEYGERGDHCHCSTIYLELPLEAFNDWHGKVVPDPLLPK